MKLLINLVRKINLRHYATTPTTASGVSWCYTKLTHRSLLRVRGQAALQFLQGIVTNDTGHLAIKDENRPTSIYSMMLNTQGRVLYDLILYVKGSETADDEKGTEDVYIECDRSVLDDMTKQLLFYRLRRKLTFDACEKELAVYSLFAKPPVAAPSTPPVGPEKPFVVCVDPRVPQLGYRAILTMNNDPAKFFRAKAVEEDEYHAMRYMLGVGEGCGDMPPGAAFPLEANGDYMNGISFHKGCYVGQELTARVHHTGVVRKRLLPLKFDADASKIRIGAGIMDEHGSGLGKFRRAVGRYGLALMYVNRALEAKNLSVHVDGAAPLLCKTEKPIWWETNIKTGEVHVHSKSSDS